MKSRPQKENPILYLENSNFNPNKHLPDLEPNTNIYSSEEQYAIAKKSIYVQLKGAFKVAQQKSEQNNMKYSIGFNLCDIAGKKAYFTVPYSEIYKNIDDIMIDNEPMVIRVINSLLYFEKEINPDELYEFMKQETNKGKSFKEIITLFEKTKTANTSHTKQKNNAETLNKANIADTLKTENPKNDIQNIFQKNAEHKSDVSAKKEKNEFEHWIESGNMLKGFMTNFTLVVLNEMGITADEEIERAKKIINNSISEMKLFM